MRVLLVEGNRCDRPTWRRGWAAWQDDGLGFGSRVTEWVMPVIMPRISTGTMLDSIAGSS